MKGIIIVIIITASMLIFSLGLTKEIKRQISLVKGETSGWYVYVFNREKEVWNRATKEDLKNAKCEELRMFIADAMMSAKE